jgi:HD-GYP domain-containing protein (c-di-GMP phosphodiesterase class II)
MVALGQPAQIDTSGLDELRTCVTLLSTAHGYRDGFTVEHEDRVAKLVVNIGAQLGLSASRLEVLRLSAIVHDVGKMPSMP